jgi:hypothetical protein
MPEQLNLSCWVRDFDSVNMLGHFEELLRLFPFSRQKPGILSVRVYALEFVEPPVAEQAFTEETGVDAALDACREFENPDCVYVVEGWWDLFRFDRAWELTPVRVSLICFGPEFDNEEKDHLRIEFRAAEDLLPDTTLPEGLRKAQSNLASLVRLVHDIEEVMPVEHKRLWTESGDFAERLEEILD